MIPLVAENFVGLGGGRAVGGFDDRVGLDLRGDFFGHRALHGGGDKHVAFAGEKFLVGDGFAVGVVEQVAVLAVVEAEVIDVDAVLVVNAAFAFRDGDDQRRRVPPGAGRHGSRRFPNPWMAILAPSMVLFCVARNLRSTFMTPRPVASSRPTEPPRWTGLPVTTPSSWWPTIML